MAFINTWIMLLKCVEDGSESRSIVKRGGNVIRNSTMQRI